MKRTLYLFIGLCLSLLLSLPVYAAKSVGVFTVVKGNIKIQRAGKKKLKKAKVGTKIKAKDVIIAGKNSRAKVTMMDNNILNISPDTKLELANYKMSKDGGEKNVTLNLMYGKVRSSVKQKYDGKKNTYRVKTKSAVAGVRGTDFIVGYSLSNLQSNIVTFEGQVEVGSGINPSGQIMNAVKVNPGQFTNVSINTPPKPPAQVPKAQLNALNKATNADTASGTEERDPASDKNSNKKEKKKEDKKQEKKETRKEKRQEKKEARKEKRQEKKEARKEKRQERKEAKKEKRQERREAKKNNSNNSPDKKEPNNKGPEGPNNKAPSDTANKEPEGPSSGDSGNNPDDSTDSANAGPGGDSRTKPSDGSNGVAGEPGPDTNPRDPASAGPNEPGSTVAGPPNGPDGVKPATGPGTSGPSIGPDIGIAGPGLGPDIGPGPGVTGPDMGMMPPPPPIPGDFGPGVDPSFGGDFGGDFHADPCAYTACESFAPPVYDDGYINDVIQDQNARLNVIINAPQ